MRVSELSVGDHVEDSRTGAVVKVAAIEPCGSCPCGWGEIELHQIGPDPRKTRKTFKQFERLKFVRRVSL